MDLRPSDATANSRIGLRESGRSQKEYNDKNPLILNCIGHTPFLSFRTGWRGDPFISTFFGGDTWRSPELQFEWPVSRQATDASRFRTDRPRPVAEAGTLPATHPMPGSRLEAATESNANNTRLFLCPWK